jgi:hypothetical protein
MTASYPGSIITFTRKTDRGEDIVAESHSIPGTTPYVIVLTYPPKQDTPSTVVIPGFTESLNPPLINEFQVNYITNIVYFNVGNAGASIAVTYVSAGDNVIANHPNKLQDEVAAVETTLGTNVHGSLTSLKDRLAVFLNNDGTPKLLYVGVSAPSPLLSMFWLKSDEPEDSPIKLRVWTGTRYKAVSLMEIEE